MQQNVATSWEISQNIPTTLVTLASDDVICMYVCTQVGSST